MARVTERQLENRISTLNEHLKEVLRLGRWNGRYHIETDHGRHYYSGTKQECMDYLEGMLMGLFLHKVY